MKLLPGIALTLALIINPAYADSCTAPKFVKKIENYEIIATNDSTIETKDAFSGDDLSYKIQVKPKDRRNLIVINTTTGTIKIKAEAKDNFDVSVIANNKCGTASTSFNVIIDEEE
jgi:hypothetical protein